MSETTVTAEALNDLRQRYLEGKPWTREELKNAIFTMIGDRLSSVQATPKAKAAKAAPVSLDDMLPGQVPEATEPVAQDMGTVPRNDTAIISPPVKKPGSFF